MTNEKATEVRLEHLELNQEKLETALTTVADKLWKAIDDGFKHIDSKLDRPPIWLTLFLSFVLTCLGGALGYIVK